MDWDRAIERNSEALKAVVAALFAMLGLAGGATVARIPRPLHRAVLSILRPAESAVRRLIVIAARDLEVRLAPARLRPQGLIPHGAGHRRSFQLFDRRKRFVIGRKPSGSPSPPRIHIFGGDPRVMVRPPAPLALPAPPDDGRIDGRRLASRLAALKSALDDLPRQARRLVRVRTKRER